MDHIKGLSLFSDQEQRRVNSEKRTKFVKFVFNAIDPNETKLGKKSIGIKEISKKVPRWSHKLITELDQQMGEFEDHASINHQLRSRKAKRVVIFTDNNATNDPEEEVALISYSQQSDFRRGKEGEFKILESREEQTKREEKKEKDKKEDNKRKEQARIAIEEAWDNIPFAQIIRGYILGNGS
ncbi:hypothetical protein H5410_064465 [Solanum commersonii]|uniref:Protein TIC 214 n=1 Tax=Solanum commersonii TaxID=4109 RepID=A0A9J5VZ98_SOLCO|nr:hypothetical protein H5410_064465 [Solanum commersonii]